MTTLFVSDLHLDAAHPEIGDQFIHFVDQQAKQADALYILGDLFESWVGDDDPQPEKDRISKALFGLHQAGIDCYFVHGNRDFLIGQHFAAQSGVQILAEETVIELYGQRVLIMHGDTLCTDDQQYQQFRLMVRDSEWQKQFLAMPLQQRLAMAGEARRHSMSRTASLREEIMDVNNDAVLAILDKHQQLMLLHGHTHRPAVHRIDCDLGPATRIVLGDWYDQGSYVRWDQNGPQLKTLPRSG